MREPGTVPQFDEMEGLVREARMLFDAGNVRQSERTLRKLVQIVEAQMTERVGTSHVRQLAINPSTLT